MRGHACQHTTHADYRAYITERNVRNEIRISQLQITAT